MTLIGKNYIAGEWLPFCSAVDTQPCFPSYNPVNGNLIGNWPETPIDFVKQVVAIAREKQRSWRELSRIARSEYFDNLVRVVKKHFDKIVHVISLETGKNLNESQ